METAEPLAQAPRPGDRSLARACWKPITASGRARRSKSLRRLKLWRIVQNAPFAVALPRRRILRRVPAAHLRRRSSAICAQHDPKDLVACVSHADPIKLAVAFYLGLPLDHFQRLALPPAPSPP